MSDKQELVRLGRRLVDLGLSRGTAGNISILSDGGEVIGSPSGSDLGELDSDHLSRLSRRADGALVQESGPKASKEMAMHAAMYRRCGAGAVVHTHSFHAVQASCLPPWSEHCAVPPYAPYFAMTIGNLPLIPYLHPGDPALGDLLDERELDFRAALLAHHGLILFAETVDAAIAATVEIDEACRLAVSLEGVAGAQVLDGRATSELARRNGRPWGLRGDGE